MIYDLLYLWCKEQLKAVAEVKNVEMDSRQDDDRTSENQLITTPCVLVSFPGTTDMDDLGNGLQEGLMDVTLRLITVNYAWKDDRIRKVGKVNHDDIARKIYQQMNNLRYGLLSQIPEFAALANTADDHTFITTLRRSQVGRDARHSIYLRSEQTFTLRVEDFTALKVYEPILATLAITSAEFD